MFYKSNPVIVLQYALSEIYKIHDFTGSLILTALLFSQPDITDSL